MIFRLRHEFDAKIEKIVGVQARENIELFQKVGLNLGRWQANTNGKKYYEVWPQLDYLKLYQCICDQGVVGVERTLTLKEQKLLYPCFKKLLLFNALVVFERKRLKYEQLNPEHKSFTSESFGGYSEGYVEWFEGGQTRHSSGCRCSAF